MSKLTTLTSILLICLLSFILITTAEYAQSTTRQTPSQRQNYYETASKRYAERLSARTKITQDVSQLPIINDRVKIVDKYSKARFNRFNQQYSISSVNHNLKLTPRQEYLKQWDTLSPTIQSELTIKKNEIYNLFTSVTNWIPFTTPEFIKYALQGPRPYWLWITFTALDTSIHCPTCTTYHSHWERVTPAIQQDAINNPNESLPLVMAIIQPSTAREVWKALNLNRAPVSVLLPPEFDFNAKIDISKIMSSGVLRQTMMMNPALEDLINPLQSNGFDIQLPPPPQPGFFFLAFIFTIITIGIFGVYLIFPTLLKLQGYRAPFVIISLLFYLYAASGGGFIKSNKPPATSYNNGQEIWVSREYSQMLGIELYVVMFMHGFTALGLFCGIISLIPYGLTQKILQLTTPVNYEQDCNRLTTNTTTANNNTVITPLDESLRLERRLSYHLFKYIPQDLVFAIGFGIFCIGYVVLLSVYKVKMPSYPFGF